MAGGAAADDHEGPLGQHDGGAGRNDRFGLGDAGAAVLDRHGPDRQRVEGGRLDGAAGRHVEAGVVPGAAQLAADQQPLGHGRPEMGAFGPDGAEGVAVAHQHGVAPADRAGEQAGRRDGVEGDAGEEVGFRLVVGHGGRAPGGCGRRTPAAPLRFAAASSRPQLQVLSPRASSRDAVTPPDRDPLYPGFRATMNTRGKASSRRPSARGG